MRYKVLGADSPSPRLTHPDVPTLLPEACVLAGVIDRPEARDVLIVKAGRPHCKIGDLPSGSVIGTSSVRRTAQLALRYPHLVVKDMRGNIATRLSKLDAEDSGFDALILAAAGLLRLDFGDRISQYLDSQNSGMLYAVGQGAVGIETRASDQKTLQLIAKVNDLPIALACTAERSLLRKLEGGCSAPLGVETRWIGDGENRKLELKAIVVSVDGKEFANIEAAETVSSMKAADAFGTRVAEELIKRGAGPILANIKAKKLTKPTDL